MRDIGQSVYFLIARNAGFKLITSVTSLFISSVTSLFISIRQQHMCNVQYEVEKRVSEITPVTLRQPTGLTTTNAVEINMREKRCKYLSGKNLPRIKIIRGKLFPSSY